MSSKLPEAQDMNMLDDDQVKHNPTKYVKKKIQQNNMVLIRKVSICFAL